MCLGNRAEVSAHYVNSQLRALWENSQKCVEKHDNGLKPSRSDLEYGFAFSQFYFGKHNRYHPTKEDLSFFASFGCPRLEFVCNHEVILYLDVKEGHCNVEPSAGHNATKHSFVGYTIAFRVEFTGHTVNNVTCDAIGNAPSYDLNFIVLDMNSASFADRLSFGPHDIDFKDHTHSTFIQYLSKHYLGLLKRAGYHVLYSLPDFDNLSRPQTIDYSVIADRSLITTEIFGISVVQVNRYLKGLWLQAAAHIDEHGTGNNYSSYKSFYLAEHRSTWTESHEDIQFHAFFGPLQVQGLCKREVVVYLDIQDVNFYIGEFSDIPNHKFSDWKIALIVDLVYEESEQGSIKTLKLDLNTARFCEHLSVFKGDFEDMELFHRLRTTLIRYMTVHYLSILEESGHHSIYNEDIHIIHTHEESDENSSDEDEDITGCWCEDEADCGHTYVHGHVYWGRLFKERIIHPHVHDYDLVMAVSQGSINKHWKLLWETAFNKAEVMGIHEHHGKYDHDRTLEVQLGLSLADYVFEKEGHVHFSSSFLAPQVQLVCSPGSHKAIVYFQLRDGFLKTLGADKGYNPSGAEHHFSRLTLAFEVDLKLRDSSDHRKSSDAIIKFIGQSDHYNFKQLILDFRTAKFSDSRSTLPGLFDGTNYRLIRSKREALLHYFIHHYFPTLIVAGHDVLYTLPTWKEGTHAHSITSLTFQITPFTFGPNGSFVEGIHGRQRAIFDRNCIVFLGMTGGRQLPSTLLPASGNWASGFGKEVTYGTVTLSRRTFLEGKLLSLLAHINAQTTVVPSFSGVEDGEWILQLTTWNNHSRKKNRECRWRELSNHAANALEFDWTNLDRWNYEHEGDEGSNGSYRVSCETRNKLLIPTNSASSGVCAIKLSGTVVLKLSFQGTNKQWHNEVSARWSTTITMSSEGAQGFSINVSPDRITPDFHDHQAEGELGRSTFASAFALLQAQFHTAISFEHVARELKTFEGVWPLLFTGSSPGRLSATNPTFNLRGDLLLELKPYVDVIQHKHSQLYSSVARGVPNGDGQKPLGFFRTLSGKVEHAIESHLSLRSPPPATPPNGKASAHVLSESYAQAQEVQIDAE